MSCVARKHTGLQDSQMTTPKKTFQSESPAMRPNQNKGGLIGLMFRIRLQRLKTAYKFSLLMDRPVISNQYFGDKKDGTGRVRSRYLDVHKGPLLTCAEGAIPPSRSRLRRRFHRSRSSASSSCLSLSSLSCSRRRAWRALSPCARANTSNTPRTDAITGPLGLASNIRLATATVQSAPWLAAESSAPLPLPRPPPLPFLAVLFGGVRDGGLLLEAPTPLVGLRKKSKRVVNSLSGKPTWWPVMWSINCTQRFGIFRKEGGTANTRICRGCNEIVVEGAWGREGGGGSLSLSLSRFPSLPLSLCLCKIMYNTHAKKIASGHVSELHWFPPPSSGGRRACIQHVPC